MHISSIHVKETENVKLRLKSAIGLNECWHYFYPVVLILIFEQLYGGKEHFLKEPDKHNPYYETLRNLVTMSVPLSSPNMIVFLFSR